MNHFLKREDSSRDFWSIFDRMRAPRTISGPFSTAGGLMTLKMVHVLAREDS